MRIIDLSSYVCSSDLALMFDVGLPPFLYVALLTGTQVSKNYPNVNPAYGRAAYRFGVGSFNTGYDITDGIEFYSFGSIGYRNAEAFANYRAPNRVVATAGGLDSGGVSTDDYNNIVAADPSRIFARNGFVPQLAFRGIRSKQRR